MTPRRRSILLSLGALALIAPLTVQATEIVFDPTNFAKAVQEASQDAQMVQQLQQELQNQLKMIKSWGFSQLTGILTSMGQWQQIFASAGTTYSTSAPGAQLDSLYPSTPSFFAGTTDASIAQQRVTWSEEERSVLTENRTVQNQAYQQLQSTANRIDADMEHSDSAPGVTSAVQAGNEELAIVVAQVQTLESQEVTEARTDAQHAAQEQAEAAYSEQQRQQVRTGWEDPPKPTSQLDNPFPLANG